MTAMPRKASPKKQVRQGVTRDIIPTDHAEQAYPATNEDSPATPATATRVKGPLVARKEVKVLFFAANADEKRLLAVGQEHDAIDTSIGDKFRLIAKLSGRLSDLHQALLDHRPDILHLACHGSTQAELLLMQDGGGVSPVSAAELAETLRVLQGNLSLVVFNACFSSTQASAVRESVGLAIGMGKPIEDSAAVKFAATLYRALASGLSVQDAFDLGKAALKASSASDAMPGLSAREGIDACKVCFVRNESPNPSFWMWILIAASAVAITLAVVPRLFKQPDAPSPSPGMVRFAAAEVRMGVFAADLRPQECRVIPANEDCAELAHPETIRETHVESFDLDQREVTNGEFATWLKENIDLWRPPDEYGIVTTRADPPIQLIRTRKCGDGLTITPEGRAQVTSESARWPVVCVTWHGADEYCRAHGKRLPLEVEWELAAKGGEGRPFPWGVDRPRQDGVAFDLRYGAQAHPRAAGSSPQDVSPNGVYDLGGNVGEWVEDRRDSIEQKTLRGGSFSSRGPCHLLSSGCARTAGDSFHKDLGFRCARSVIDRQREER